jgi:hypothetical protein
MSRRNRIEKMRSLAAFALLTTFAFLCAPSAVCAEEVVDPKRFAFDIPAGPVKHVELANVLTRDGGGTTVVAKLHVVVGENSIVMLPSGELVARRPAEIRPTDKPFVPETKEQLAKRLTNGPLPGFRVKTSRRYVYVYNTSDEFVEGTARILESMFFGLVQYLREMRLSVREPDLPLVIIMFETEGEYQRFRKMPPGVVAYYNIVSNEVAMYEQSALSNIKPELAIQQKISTIAHEGVHQILHNIGVQQRLSVWPQWISEGTAEFFAPTTVGKRFTWKGAGKVNDLRMFELERYLKAKAADAPAGQMIEQTVLAAKLRSTGYATSWALVHYLARYERRQFHRLMRAMSEIRPMEGAIRVENPGVVKSNLVEFKEIFGDDLAEMERLLVGHLKKLPYDDPFAEWPHYIAMIALHPPSKRNRMANVFHTKAAAERWIQQTMAKVPEDRREGAKAAIGRAVNRAAAEQAATRWLSGG